MMPYKYLIGNWKMHKTQQEAIAFIQQLVPKLKSLNLKNIHVILAPAFVHLVTLKAWIENVPYLALCGQNCHHEKEGAYTGEISAAMLACLDVNYVLVGHSERRQFQQENHELLTKKVQQVLQAGMRPIFCCGESATLRHQDKAEETIQKQLIESLANLTACQAEKLLIAYEPVWAIGTGQVASVETITTMHNWIRTVLIDQYGKIGQSIPILYGGSCNPDNAADIFACPNVSGGLIGSASLQADHFIQILMALQQP